MSNIGILLTIVAVTYVCATPSPVKPDQPCICTAEYKPVCGTDSKTYANYACLNCELPKNPTLKKRHDGPCKNDGSHHLKVSSVAPTGNTTHYHQDPAKAIPWCACPLVNQLVCGSDGITYDNDCLLKCAAKTKPNLAKVHDGPCKRTDTKVTSCACPKNKQPVCGTDGVTYNNICLLKCAAKTKPGLTLLHEGECKNHHPKGSQVVKRAVPSCYCPMHIQPVCGSDGVTYNNDCLLKCAAKTKPNLRKVHEGACKKAHTTHQAEGAKVVKRSVPACPCPKNMRPVCGTDGVTYNNICLLKCAAKTKPGLTLLNEGECKNHHPKGSQAVKRAVPSCYCPMHLQPVCGSDGVTYNNTCLLKCAAKTKPNLRKAHEGPCKKAHTTHQAEGANVVKRSVPACPCPKNMRPVCGTDGVTYNNICLLKCAAKTKPGLTLLHEGECKNHHPKGSQVVKRAVPSCYCPMHVQPVCGSDGITYNNDCLLKCAAKTKPNLRKVHEGACKKAHTTHQSEGAKVVKRAVPTCHCVMNKHLVCGSDGVTYNNICLLKCTAKTKPGLKKVRDGPCEPKRQNREV